MKSTENDTTLKLALGRGSVTVDTNSPGSPWPKVKNSAFAQGFVLADSIVSGGIDSPGELPSHDLLLTRKVTPISPSTFTRQRRGQDTWNNSGLLQIEQLSLVIELNYEQSQLWYSLHALQIHRDNLLHGRHSRRVDCLLHRKAFRYAFRKIETSLVVEYGASIGHPLSRKSVADP